MFSLLKKIKEEMLLFDVFVKVTLTCLLKRGETVKFVIGYS